MALVDQLVDKCLFSPWQQVELDNVERSVSKSGWSPMPEGYRWLNKTFPDNHAVYAVDKTAWDWTMPGWVIKPYYSAKASQCRDPTPDYLRATAARFAEVLRDATVRLPDGSVYRQTTDGLMKSGWYLTLSMNSAAQFFQHSLAWQRAGGIGELPLMWAMGDDMLVNFNATQSLTYMQKVRGPRLAADDVEAYMSALATTGCLVKIMENQKEFAGFRFTDLVVTPLYQDKHRFMLSYVNPSKKHETLLSMALMYSLTPNFGWLSDLRKQMDFPLNSSFRRWAQGLAHLAVLTADPDWVV